MFKEGNVHILSLHYRSQKIQTTRIVKTSEKTVAEATRPDLKKKKKQKKEKTAHRGGNQYPVADNNCSIIIFDF